MPPLLVALAVAALSALAYKRKPVHNPAKPPAIVETTPENGGVGITTGFAPPPIATSVSGGLPAPKTHQTNTPSSAASGVPNFSSHTQEFNTAPAKPVPGVIAHPPYYGSNPLTPIYSSVEVPESASKTGSCSCGGGQHHTNDCSISRARNRDGGCLAPTKKALVQNAPPGLLEKWAANIASVHATPFEHIQQQAFDHQQSNPTGDDLSMPAAPQLTGIGLSYRRGRRASIVGY